MERIVGAYGSLWPSQRPAVHAALEQLLATVAARRGALHALLQRLTVTLLTATLAQPDDNAAYGALQASHYLLLRFTECLSWVCRS